MASFGHLVTSIDYHLVEPSQALWKQMNFDLNSFAQKAALILSQRFNQPIVLGTPQLLKDKSRSLIVRCTVPTHNVLSGTPASVIIKYMRDDRILGFSDWASLSFLSTLPATYDLVPRFLGGDLNEHFFVLEDLGGSQNLEEILRGDNPELAQETLRALAITMARLHGATLAVEPTFKSIRNGLPEASGVGRHLEAERWLRNADKIVHWFHAVGFAMPPGFTTCLQQIAALYAHPGPFLSFTHGDPAPSNNHVINGRVTLLDFEYGDFRHALYDITGWNILCPLPSACVAMMSAAFQQELAGFCPAARDPVQYAHAWAMLSAYRALALLTWIPLDILHANRPWVDAQWTSRHAVFAAMVRLQDATANIAELGPVCEAAARLTKALRRRWPEFEQVTDLATEWPALRNAYSTKAVSM